LIAQKKRFSTNLPASVWQKLQKTKKQEIQKN